MNPFPDEYQQNVVEPFMSTVKYFERLEKEEEYQDDIQENTDSMEEKLEELNQ